MTNDKFFLDVYNKLIIINEKTIFIVFDKKGDMWFPLNALLESFGYKDVKSTKKDMKLDDKNIAELNDLKNIHVYIKNLQNNTNMINEHGLYEILMKSGKKQHRVFEKNITRKLCQKYANLECMYQMQKIKKILKK